jgi:hypothetical protein
MTMQSTTTGRSRGVGSTASVRIGGCWYIAFVKQGRTTLLMRVDQDFVTTSKPSMTSSKRRKDEDDYRVGVVSEDEVRRST